MEPVKKGYKKTEVGIIPEDWSVAKLGDITTLLTNGFVGTATTHYTEARDGVLYIQGYNVLANSFNFTGIKRVTKEFHQQHKKSSLKEGDLLTIQTGDVGLTTIVPKLLEGSNCHALIISRFIPTKAYSKFYVQYFNSTIGRGRLKELETGTTMKHLNVGDMLHWKIPLPSTLTEQKAIADALSDVDKLIASLEKLIAKKKAIKQGAMQALLTPPHKGGKRLDGFSGEWKEVRLGEIISRFTTGLNPRTNFQLNKGGICYYVTIKNFRDGKLFLDENCDKIDFKAISIINSRSDLKIGDILFASIGRIGDAYLITQQPLNWNINESVFSFRPNRDRVTPDFLYYVLTSESLKRKLSDNATGSTFQSVKMADLRRTDVYIPSSITEQIEIAKTLHDLDDSIEFSQNIYLKVNLLKQGMMQELLTGKTRLV